MARQQHFDWFLSRQRGRKTAGRKLTRRRQVRRRSTFESLEARNLLSANCNLPSGELDLTSISTVVEPPVVQPHGLWFIPEGEASPTNWDESNHDHDGDGIADHAPEDHDPGCCCEACTGSVGGATHDHDGDGIPDHASEDHDPGCCCEACVGSLNGGVAEFNAFAAWPDQDLNAEGIQLTYSYSNFFDGGMGDMTEEELRAATEEALLLWATYSPLHFIEVEDSGPIPDDIDTNYAPADHPNLRIGHHFIDGGAGANVLAHAFFPFSVDTNGLAGDTHFDNGNTWGLGTSSGAIDVIEVMTHEIGHAIGLGHEFDLEAIMNPIYGSRFEESGDGFLLQDDINGIRALYGEGVGSVSSLMPSFVPFRINTLDDVDDVELVTDEDTGEMSLEDTTPETLSLREAIRLSADRGGRLRISFDAAVFVDPGVMQTINLDPGLGPLNIPTAMLIEGPGSELLTIQASDAGPAMGNGSRIFEIMFEDPFELGLSVDVNISGLSLTGGDTASDGGAIHSTENLTLTDIRADNNHSQSSGGTIYSEGTLSLNNSSIENSTAQQDGGAIYGLGDVTLSSSLIHSSNAMDQGGAIAIGGEGNELLVQSSTISGNSASDDGGGVHIFDLNPFRVRFLHSTVTGNTAGETGGGIYLLTGTAVLDHSIIAGNLAQNQSGAPSSTIAPDIDSVNGIGTPNVLANYSIVGNTTQANISELVGNLLDVDPMLDPVLKDNGGLTLTHRLMTGSPAIDAGDVAVPVPPVFDQRGLGFDRIVSDVIDIGALEADGFDQAPLMVNTLVDENDANPTPDDLSLSLREAIAIANNTLGLDRIFFAPELNGGTIDLVAGLGELVVTDSLLIDADDFAFGLTLDAATTGGETGHRIFRVDDGNATSRIDFTLDGLTLQGGNVAGNGGAILSLENLSLHTVEIMNNTASGEGGGVYHGSENPQLNSGGNLVIENTTFAGNIALNAGDGGGLWSLTEDISDEEPTTGLIRNSTFSGNNAGDEGGGIFNKNGLLALEHVTITNNSAEVGGGVVSFGNLETKTTVYSSIIAGNTLNDSQQLEFRDVQRSRQTPPAANTFESLGYNLIGTGNALLAFNNNDQTGVSDPGLGLLTNNGGKTQTHALLPGSPAIDSGDPLAVLPSSEVADEGLVVVPAYDQRGLPFTRIVAGRFNGFIIIDIGAFELPTPEPSGDFDGDGDTDGADFLAWQRGLGTVGAQPSDGDANFDGKVDSNDLQQWGEDFGSSIGPSDSVDSTHALAQPESFEQTISTEESPVVAASQPFFVSDLSLSNDDTESQETGGQEHIQAAVFVSDLVAVSPISAEVGTIRDQNNLSSKLIASGTALRQEVESLDVAFESLGFERIFGN